MSILKFIEDKPRIILFAGNNDVAHKIYISLIDRQEHIVHVYNENDDIALEQILSWKPDVMITCYWPYLLSKEMIEIPKYGTINFFRTASIQQGLVSYCMGSDARGSRSNITLN